jgi:hypothetical protein
VPRDAHAVSLIQNGDFSLGNTGFSSDYTADSSTVVAGTYCIDTNPLNCHFSVASHGDHTTGTGLMLNANGALTAGQAVWRQTIPVTQDTRYVFDGWVASWARASGVDPSPAQLLFLVDGVHVVDFIAPAPVGQWVEFTTSWESAKTGSATIEIVDTNLDNSGNDFSLDDLSVTIQSVICRGDCDRTGIVTADDLLQMTQLALGLVGVAECDAGDTNTDGKITVDEILMAVNRAVSGCGPSGQ